MQNVKKYLDKILEVVTITLFLVMVAVTMWQVISRYILNDPSSVTEEFLRFGLIWLSMLAAAYVVGKKEHIAFSLLSEKLSPSNKLILDTIIQASFLIFAVIIMIYGGGRATTLTMGQISPSLHLPMGYVYLSLPVSGVFALIYSIINLKDLYSNNDDSTNPDTTEQLVK